MRIWHQSFTVLEELPQYAALLEGEIRRVCRAIPRSFWTDRFLEPIRAVIQVADLSHALLYRMHEMQWVASALEAERQGFDAIVQANAPSPMTREIRSVVSIPIIGYGETAFNLGGLYGRRIGMLLFNVGHRDSGRNRQGNGRRPSVSPA